MAKSKQNKEKTKLTWDDFETYLPEYGFDEKQMQFFKDTFEIQTKLLVLLIDAA